MKIAARRLTAAPFDSEEGLRLPRICFFALLLLALFPAEALRANVYATRVLVNGGQTNLTVPNGTPITIGYLLNEAATAGATIAIKSEAATVRTIVLTNGAPGTLRGTNLVEWDGKDNNGTNAAGGTYTVSVTAQAAGYGDWTQISDDLNPGNYVFEPRGIAVNRNTNSPFYGRVFVANATPGPHPLTNPGDAVGLQKLNADGSYAEEGAFSDGGWPWAGDGFSPWKVEVSEEDRVCVNDFTSKGIVLSFDQTVSTNSQLLVLRTDNYPNDGNVEFNGPFISGTGTNTAVWMCDRTPDGVGIRRWKLSTNGIIATNDLGSTIVQTGGGSDLNVYPNDVALDRSNRLYTIQYRQDTGDGSYRLMRFPAYDELGTPETLADWKVGTNDDTMGGAFGVAVNPAGTYVAVAFRGTFPQPVGPWQFSSVRVFDANDGTSIATVTPPATPTHDYRDVAWDNAGNLYAVDNYDSAWRVYSPPGSNAATTVALPTVELLAPPQPPVITGPPRGQTYGYGDGATLSVTATGTPPFAYQWRLNGADLAGATGSSLNFAALQFTNAGLYSVVISNVGGTISSAIAVVNVFPRLSWQVNPPDLTLSWAGPFTLQSAAAVEGPYADVSRASSPYVVNITSEARSLFRVRSAPFALTGDRLPDGQVALSGQGIIGCNFVVQASTNLTTWVNLQTNPSPFSLVDTNAPQFPLRFYRAVLAH